MNFVSYLTSFVCVVVALLCVGQSWGDDGRDKGWLPISDGYIWPASLEEPPDFVSEELEFLSLPLALVEVIREYWPVDIDPRKISIAEVDLNMDGVEELFVEIPMNGGTGGVFFEIFSSIEGGAYKSIGNVLLCDKIEFLEPKNGWLQIEGVARNGGGNLTRYLMAFSGEDYEMIRQEGHDFFNREFSIYKVSAE